MSSISIRRALLAGALAASLAVAGAVTVSTAASRAGGTASTDGNQGKKPVRDTSVAIVQLTGTPLATASGIDRGKSNRVNFNGARTKAYRTQLRLTRDAFRDWMKVNAPKARISKGYDISVNAVVVKLNGTSLATLRLSPLVLRAQYAGLYYPNDALDPDLDLINAISAWGGGGAAGAGAGVKVGIIDSGIDQDHACFDDAGDSDGPGNFTNNKVIVAKVFNMRAGVMRLTPEGIGAHGTHVAGTVACDYGTTAVVEGVTVPHTISGVAPAALLGNYNVFPGDVENARSEDILNALDAAYVDGMNIVNMSLGGGSYGIQDLLTIAVDNLDRGGMLSSISAGNDGPGFSTVGSPGMAARALTAGASTVAHIVSGSIDTNIGSALAVAAEFTEAVPGTYGPIDVVEGTGPTGVEALADVSQACTPIPDGTGIAVVARGTCDFVTKVDNVQAAGYDAVIVINREPGAFVMGGDPASTRTIPAVMIDLADADIALTASGDVTLNDPAYYNPYGTANEMADFSSEGPTDVDRRIKPDVVSPGVNVLSSVPGGEFAFYNGTSMAAPHLAGAAAVVWSQHPTWTAWQVRSAITNTADLGATVVHYEDDLADDPNLVGAGLLDVLAATNATALMSPVSASFGTAERGAGHVITRYVTLKNLGSGTLTARVVDRHGSATFTVSGSVGAASTGVLTVVARTAKGATVGHSWATVEILDGDTVVAHLRLYVLVA
ncbi:MAG: S8 family serine peptidase [Ilumatobacteraceae bacterium]